MRFALLAVLCAAVASAAPRASVVAFLPPSSTDVSLQQLALLLEARASELVEETNQVTQLHLKQTVRAIQEESFGGSFSDAKNADSLRRQTSSTAVLPELIVAIEREEQRLYSPGSNLLSALLHALTAGVRTALARWRLERLIRRMVIQAARQSPTMASHGPRLAATAYAYAVRRLDANRRLAEHRFYVRMFSLWHVVHVPFFIMLLVAGIVHVISVNVY